MRLSIILAIFLVAYAGDVSSQDSYVPKKGFVNSDTTAIKIAIAISVPIYGNEIYQEMPFHTALIGDSIWVITGNLSEPYTKIVDGDTILYVTSGGVVYIELRKSNGQIIKVMHGK